MKYQEAKRLIVLEWDRWIQTQTIDSGRATGRDSLKFFVELQDTQPTLLDFQPRGRDKWRVIHAWLLSERRVEGEIGGRRYLAGRRASVRSWIDGDAGWDRVHRLKADPVQPHRRSDQISHHHSQRKPLAKSRSEKPPN